MGFLRKESPIISNPRTNRKQRESSAGKGKGTSLEEREVGGGGERYHKVANAAILNI